mgnify:CR=1 FL=1
MKLENFGPIKLFNLELQNPFRNVIYRYRINKANKKRNKDLNIINSLIVRNRNVENYEFKWDQLVWQEIWMYCKIGEQVTETELSSLCDQRGFDLTMNIYLTNMLKYIGLGKNL